MFVFFNDILSNSSFFLSKSSDKLAIKLFVYAIIAVIALACSGIGYVIKKSKIEAENRRKAQQREMNRQQMMFNNQMAQNQQQFTQQQSTYQNQMPQNTLTMYSCDKCGNNFEQNANETANFCPACGASSENLHKI